MKRLSLETNKSSNVRFRLNQEIECFLSNERGSYIKLSNGKTIEGVCINCEKKPCLVYQDAELQTVFFDSFPHNTSKRVCPTSAISVDTENQSVRIDSAACILCGLCIRRCPTAAIQLDISSNTCRVGFNSDFRVECTSEEQLSFLEVIDSKEHQVSFSSVPEAFSKKYQKDIFRCSKETDVCEILVRNNFVNMGIPTNAKAVGNNHNRTEFFGQKGDLIIIGESTNSNKSKDSDLLSVPRRILDDEAVMIGRYGRTVADVVPISVMNGLPNKRTDYYEVVYDIQSVLGIPISTITFHLLRMLNLYRKSLSIADFKSFRVDHKHQELLTAMERFIPDVSMVDLGWAGSDYRPIK